MSALEGIRGAGERLDRALDGVEGRGFVGLEDGERRSVGAERRRGEGR